MLARLKNLIYLPVFHLIFTSGFAEAVIVEGNFRANIYWQEKVNAEHQPLEAFWKDLI